MQHKPLYVFFGCRLNIDGQEVVLILTPFSKTSESERALIMDILERLKQKQPVIIVYIRINQATLGVVMPAEWESAIESRSLASSLLKKLPIYEVDLPPKILSSGTASEPPPVASSGLFSKVRSWFQGG